MILMIILILILVMLIILIHEYRSEAGSWVNGGALRLFELGSSQRGV